MKKHLLLPLFILLGFHAFPQNFQWAASIGSTGDQAGNSVAVDGSGNVYTTGSYTGTIDFDPGAGTFTMTAATGTGSAYILKLDASGNFIWAKNFGGTNPSVFAQGFCISTDASGNVYTAGAFRSTVDFDPGPGTYTMAANTSTANSEDIFVSKLDASGNFIWAKSMGGPNLDVVNAMAIDPAGNVYTTGYFYATADFDPGIPVYSLTSAGQGDVFISKLDASGNFIYAKRFGASASGSDDAAHGIGVDAAGAVYTTGMFYSVVDFDPGPATYTIATTHAPNCDVFISKLDAAGNFVWAKSLNGNNGNEWAYGLALDAGANVYTTGFFSVVVDFDPGPGTYTLNTGGYNNDAYISKLDSSGSFVWAKRIGSSSDNDKGTAITTDAAGNVYTTGVFRNAVDLDPGPGVNTFTSAGTYNDDIFISKLDAAGNYINAEVIGSANVESPNSMVADAAGSLYLTGSYPGTVDFDPTAGVYNLSSVSGTLDIFILKLGACTLPASAAPIAGTATLCANGTATYSTNTVAGATDYIWTFPTGAVINSGQNTTTVSVTFSNTAGTVSVKPSSTCGYGAASSFTVSLNPAPYVYATVTPSATVCSGSTVMLSGAGAATYTWTGGITNNVAFSPTTTATYTLTGTSSAGCTNTYTQTVTTNSLPAVTVTASNSMICQGASTSLSGGGASTYTWTGGVTNGATFSPTLTATYTVTGTGPNGCKNSASQTVMVNPLPAVAAGSASICAGNSATLSASGAATYTWSTGDQTAYAVVSPASNTVYTVTGTSLAGCVKMATALVTVSATPVITVNTATLCAGATATLTAMGADTYSWSTGDNTAGIAVSPGATTTYTVSADLSGCSATAVQVTTVTVYALPSVSVTSTSPILCTGHSATLTASGAATYAWSTSQSGTAIAVSPGSNATYTVSGTGANGCQNFTVFTQTVAVCTGISKVQDPSAMGVYPNPADGYFYLQSGMDNVMIELYDVTGRKIASQAGSGELTRIDISGLEAGIYQVRVLRNDIPLYQAKLVKQ